MSYEIGIQIYNQLPPELQYMIDNMIQLGYMLEWRSRMTQLNQEHLQTWCINWYWSDLYDYDNLSIQEVYLGRSKNLYGPGKLACYRNLSYESDPWFDEDFYIYNFITNKRVATLLGRY